MTLDDDRTNPGTGSAPLRYPGTFVLSFREALAGMGWQVRRWQGDAAVCLDEQGEEHVVGLENLFRRIRREDRATWPGAIADFFEKVRASQQHVSADLDLATAADRLLVRIGQPFSRSTGALKVWSLPMGETGLELSLVIDHAETMSYVTEEMIAKTNQPGEEWLSRAIANLKARTPASCLEVVHEPSGMLLCSVGDAYDAARALILEDLLPASTTHGSFAALPSRDEFLVLPVSRTALANVHLLRVLAKKNQQSAPYPISDEVYWIYHGKWHRFPIDLRGSEVTIRPPEEFVPILDVLEPEQESPPEDEPQA